MPGLLQELAASNLRAARSRQQYDAMVAAAGRDAVDEAQFGSALRQMRNREMVRIAWRDLSGIASLDTILAELSALADACICGAAGFAGAALSQRHGIPQRDGRDQQLLVLAMGKLGGAELNFSSDVDLILLYPENGETSGDRPLNHERFFARQAQSMIRLLANKTSDGFVYRVDTRLRPFGDSGPIAMSFAAFEAYLVQHGREWERYAYVKARALSGTAEDRAELLALITPFVYRRYLDFGVFESLRNMHGLIRHEIARAELADDVKRGPGGIREIEFVVQALQLLRGGREPALRTPSLPKALDLLVQRGRVTAEAATELAEAWQFLRRLENRIQAWDDRQWHRLPDEPLGLLRLACAMNEPDEAALLAQLAEHAQAVTRHFDDIVIGPAPGPENGMLNALWTASADRTQAPPPHAGYEDPQRVLDALRRLRASPRFLRCRERGRDRLDRLMPALLTAAATKPGPEVTLERALGIVEAVLSRSAYLALLNEHPPVLDRLLTLCAQSARIARDVAEYPLLLDELIDPRCFEEPPQRARLAEELHQQFARIDRDDLELQMDALRQFQRAAVFRVAVSDLSGVLPLMQVSDCLTDIAELMLEQVIVLAEAELVARHGRPQPDGAASAPGFAVIAYGKLGGIELGYGSDLDLVFVHDGGGVASDGKRPLDPGVWFARLARRIVHFLSTPTTSGVLYEVDMRLRPSGRAGLFVSTLEGLAAYQDEQAWTWEHQALLRARGVAGDAGVRARFEALRLEILGRARDPDALRTEVLSMRERMRRELDKPPAGFFDLKQGRGGIADLEFLVQFLVLSKAAEYPELLRYSDNIRQLEALVAAGILPVGDGERLARTYRTFRGEIHRCALSDQPGIVADNALQTERDFVAGLWERNMQT